ncbi:MAG TPA: ATP-dependent helicase [Thermodesulfobacteriaceae bacterium]|nr:ATP-dependent helicase [Thermodesulfobacteriaceae bacterium]
MAGVSSEECGVWDYDDLLHEILRALEDSEIRATFREKKPVLFIDEFQDVSPIQYAIVRAMVEKNGAVTIIGDPNQAIYGFRGASPEFIHRFIDDFDLPSTVSLTIAYWCPQTFLDAAGAVLHGADVSGLKSIKRESPVIRIRKLSGPESEAAWIARTVERIVGGVSFESVNSGPPDNGELRSLFDVAVLFRANKLARPVARALENRGIPFAWARAGNFMESAELRCVWHLWEALKGRDREYNAARLRQAAGRQVNDLAVMAEKARALRGLQLLKYICQVLGYDPGLPVSNMVRQFLREFPDTDFPAFVS